MRKLVAEMKAENSLPGLDAVLDAVVAARKKFGPQILEECKAARKARKNGRDHKKDRFDSTIHELAEHVQKSVEQLSNYDKAEIRAAILGKLSSDRSERTH
jgi:hypothetical protein